MNTLFFTGKHIEYFDGRVAEMSDLFKMAESTAIVVNDKNTNVIHDLENIQHIIYRLRK